MKVSTHKMPTDEEFGDFTRWMIERGRSADTAGLYVRNLAACFEDDRGLLARIAQGGLAPKTRRTNKAALVAWAEYSEDAVLRRRLKETRLPPPERIVEKVALELDEWRAVLAAHAKADIDPFVWAALGLVCNRGFRIGDVCRLSSKDVRNGLKTGVLQYLAKGNRRIGWTVTERFSQYLEILANERGWKHAYDLIAPNCVDGYVGARQRCHRAFKRLVLEAGLDPDGLSLHIMRRTYAWHFLRFSGGDPVKLQKHMGWKSIQTAMTYVDQTQREELDAIADMMADELD